MENNKIQEIYTRLTTDQAFAEELKKFVEDKKIVSAEDGINAFVKFAKLQGYDITIDELKAFAKWVNVAISLHDQHIKITEQKRHICTQVC